MQQLLEQYLTAPGYEPQDVSALARGMGIDSRRRRELRELLQAWLEQGKLIDLAPYLPQYAKTQQGALCSAETDRRQCDRAGDSPRQR